MSGHEKNKLFLYIDVQTAVEGVEIVDAEEAEEAEGVEGAELE